MGVVTGAGGGSPGGSGARGPAGLGAGLAVDGSLAVHYAERALGGRALEVCLGRRGGRAVFRVLVQRPAGPAWAEVDAATGRLLDLGPIVGPAANDPCPEAPARAGRPDPAAREGSPWG